MMKSWIIIDVDLFRHNVVIPYIVACCLASKVCRSAVDGWNHWQMALRLRWWEGAFTHYHIFCSWSFYLLLWISYQTSGAQLCLCQLIVPCCLASKVCRSAVDSWNHWSCCTSSWQAFLCHLDCRRCIFPRDYQHWPSCFDGQTRRGQVGIPA